MPKKDGDTEVRTYDVSTGKPKSLATFRAEETKPPARPRPVDADSSRHPGADPEADPDARRHTGAPPPVRRRT